MVPVPAARTVPPPPELMFKLPVKTPPVEPKRVTVFGAASADMARYRSSASAGAGLKSRRGRILQERAAGKDSSAAAARVSVEGAGQRPPGKKKATSAAHSGTVVPLEAPPSRGAQGARVLRSAQTLGAIVCAIGRMGGAATARAPKRKIARDMVILGTIDPVHDRTVQRKNNYSGEGKVSPSPTVHFKLNQKIFKIIKKKKKK